MELQQSPLTRTPVRAGRFQKKEDRPKSDTPEKVDPGFEIDPAKTYIFETIKKSDTPRFENLGAQTKAFDPVEKRYRDMRYMATAPSIFPEEWDESFLERDDPPLGFYRNQIAVAGQDIRLMEYMLNHPLYDNSPFRVMNRPAMYTLADRDIKDSINARRHATEKRALDIISSSPMEDIRPIARVIFGITDTSDVAITNALSELVKHDKQGTKQTNAEKLLDNVNNPRLHRSFNIQSAIDNGIIVINKERSEARFSEGDVLITQLSTRDAVKELVDYTLGTDEGKRFYTALRAKAKG